MSQVPTLTPEEFEAAFQVVNSRDGLWSKTAYQALHEALVNEATRLAGELPQERMLEIVSAAWRGLDAELAVDREYGRQMRRYLWIDDQEGYTHFMHATCLARIPALVEWAVQTFRMPIIASEQEKGPRWIQ